MESNNQQEGNNFAHSPNKDRSLDNVLFESDPLITGPLRPQHDGDFDMTFKYLAQIEGGRLMEAMRVSDFDPKGGKTSPKLDKKAIEHDYDILDQLFETEGVQH